MKKQFKKFVHRLKMRRKGVIQCLSIWINSVAPRLIDLALLGTTAYILIYLLLRTGILDAPLLFLSEAFNSLHPFIAFSSLFIVGFSLPLFLQKHNSYNVKHTLINDCKNPPIYITPFAITLLSICFHGELIELCNTLSIVIFTLGLFSCLYLMKLRNKKEKNDDDIDFDMEIWLEKEIPIKNKDYDFLGFNAYTERIITLLTKTDEKKSNQVAIRGDFGSGKSSLCRLLEEKLASQKAKQFIFCHVDGWGREDSSFAGQILEIVIETLSEHTDCSALIGVPENYTNALNGSGLTSIIAVTQLFSSAQKSDPEQHLRKIDTILMSIDSHMVIVLEDFDRGPKPSKAIGELGSLLERTKDLKNINFLLCVKRDRSTIIDKICTHVEDLHEIPSEASSRLIKELLVFIGKKYPPAIFITATTNYHFMPGINPLIKTPRALKMALRRTATAWDNLRGEIDLIDLLHFNILRFCQPNAFLFFLDNFNKLSSMRDVPAQNREESKKLLDIELDNLNLTRHEIHGVKLLINSIFSDPYLVLNMEPFLHSQLSTHERIPSTRRMQRIVNRGNTNYLNRAVGESIPYNESKDQEMLKWIYSYTSDQVHNCLSKLDEVKHYETHLTDLINWTTTVEQLAIDHMEKIVDIIVKQSNELFPKNAYPYTDIADTIRNPTFPDKAYPLIDQIKRLLPKTDHTGSTIYKKSKIKIIEHITTNNAALAIYLSDYLIPTGYTSGGTPFETLNIFHENFHKIQYKTILERIDFTSYVKSLSVLCNLYTVTHIENNSFTLYGTNELNKFHKYLTENEFKITNNMIPTIAFHLDNYQKRDKSDVLDKGVKKKIKKMIENFEPPETKVNAQIEYVISIIDTWKLNIDYFLK